MLWRQLRIQVDSWVYYALPFVIKGCVSLHYINLGITGELLLSLFRHLSLKTCLRSYSRGSDRQWRGEGEERGVRLWPARREKRPALLSIILSTVRSQGNDLPSKARCAMSTVQWFFSPKMWFRWHISDPTVKIVGFKFMRTKLKCMGKTEMAGRVCMSVTNGVEHAYSKAPPGPHAPPPAKKKKKK